MSKKKVRNVLLMICFFLIVMFVQLIRYDEDRYSCRHMARDEEEYLEGLGFDVIIARADNALGTSQGHVWIVIDVGGVYIHLDSVSLFPIIPPNNTEYYESYEEYMNR